MVTLAKRGSRGLRRVPRSPLALVGGERWAGAVETSCWIGDFGHQWERELSDRQNRVRWFEEGWGWLFIWVPAMVGLESRCLGV